MTQPVAEPKVENIHSFASHAQVQLEAFYNSWEQNLTLEYTSHTAVKQWEQDVACHSSNMLLAQRQRLARIPTHALCSAYNSLASRQIYSYIIVEADDQPNIACACKQHSIK